MNWEFFTQPIVIGFLLFLAVVVVNIILFVRLMIA